MNKTIVHICILRILKGHLSGNIEIRGENDSGRYGLEIGQRHLLFLGVKGQYYQVSSCGNSSLLPTGDDTLKKVETMLDLLRTAP